MHRLALLAFAAAGLLAASTEAAAYGPVRKKHVVFAWEFGNMTPSNILEVVDSLDRTPIDGIGICPRLTDRRGRRIKAKMMDQPALEWADLEPWVPVLRELTAHKSMRECFMKSICAPTNRLDWTDDARWRTVSETMRQLARLSREGGLRGLFVDDEEYHNQRQYYWCPGDPPYDRLCEIARARGREVFTAIFSEYPDATIFFFRFLTRLRAYCNSEDLCSTMRAYGDLWPSFINGALDVLPPKAKFVDGYEYGYRWNSLENEYYYGHALQKSCFANLADESNRTKYFTQVSSATALYMDRYVNPEGVRWYAPPLDGSRVARFASDVTQATRVVDEYVWFWGERHCWADWKGKVKQRAKVSDTTWEELLPGALEAMELSKRPHEFAVRRLAKLKSAGKFKPLNDNVECRRPEGCEDDSIAKPYSTWKDEKVATVGRFFYDSSVGEGDSCSLCAEGVAKGTFVMKSGPVEPGKIYLVGFSAKGDVVGGAVYWQRDGKWDFSIPGDFVPMSEPDTNGWRHGLTAVRVPRGINGFGLQLNANLSPGQRCWYDNVFYCAAE